VQFQVHKVWSDTPNAAGVTITLNCTNASLTNDATTASEAAFAHFTVTPTGASPTCTATETVPAGYTPDQTACANVPAAASNTPVNCTITNNATATLKVTKSYTDANTTAVTATPSCTTGTIVTPLSQTVPTGATGFTFNLSALPAGATCTVSESGAPAGYAEDLAASTCDNAQSVSAAGAATCNIVNAPSVVTFNVNKTFVPDNPSGVTRVSLACPGTGTISGGNVDNHTSDITGSNSASPPFTVTAFSAGDKCSVSEISTAAGYVLTGSTNCTNVTVLTNTTSNCFLTNSTQATFVVHKDFSNNSTASVSVTLSCSPNGGTPAPASGAVSHAAPRTFTVTGFTPDPTCTATESPIPAGYTASGSPAGTCAALLSAGACTITNTLRQATFNVTKAYSPAGPVSSVQVIVTCASGSPNLTVAPSGATPVSPGAPVPFTVKGFNVGDTCSATESPVPAGYTMSQASCVSQAVTDGGAVNCTITNTLNTATLTVHKVYANHAATAPVTVHVTCTSGTPSPLSGPAAPGSDFSTTVTGFNSSGATCTATEDIPAGFAESDNCASVHMTANGTPSCTITNARATPTPSATPAHSHTPTPTPSPTAFPGTPPPGDVDCDGLVQILDGLLLLDGFAGVPQTPSGRPCNDGNAMVDGRPARDDANCDGVVDLQDFLAILKSVAGLIQLPAACPSPTTTPSPTPSVTPI
jgi:hypothetical protein